MRREYFGWGAFQSFSARAPCWLAGSIFPAVRPSLLGPYSPARRHRPHPTEQKLRINPWTVKPVPSSSLASGLTAPDSAVVAPAQAFPALACVIGLLAIVPAPLRSECRVNVQKILSRHLRESHLFENIAGGTLQPSPPCGYMTVRTTEQITAKLMKDGQFNEACRKGLQRPV